VPAAVDGVPRAATTGIRRPLSARGGRGRMALRRYPEADRALARGPRWPSRAADPSGASGSAAALRSACRAGRPASRGGGAPDRAAGDTALASSPQARPRSSRDQRAGPTSRGSGVWPGDSATTRGHPPHGDRRFDVGRDRQITAGASRRDSAECTGSDPCHGTTRSASPPARPVRACTAVHSRHARADGP
jgi:hypothetical protein